MIYDIAEILKGKLGDINYIDSLNGLAENKTHEVPDGKGGVIEKLVPYYNGVRDSCDDDILIPLAPDEEINVLVYFQNDTGAQVTGEVGNYITFQTDMKLVCWVNGVKFQDSQAGYEDYMKLDILKRLFFKNENHSPHYVHVSSQMLREEAKTPDIFRRWNYNNKLNKLLEKPYEYFSIIVRVNYKIPKSCIEDFIPEPINNC